MAIYTINGMSVLTLQLTYCCESPVSRGEYYDGILLAMRENKHYGCIQSAESEQKRVRVKRPWR